MFDSLHSEKTSSDIDTFKFVFISLPSYFHSAILRKVCPHLLYAHLLGGCRQQDIFPWIFSPRWMNPTLSAFLCNMCSDCLTTSFSLFWAWFYFVLVQVWTKYSSCGFYHCWIKEKDYLPWSAGTVLLMQIRILLTFVIREYRWPADPFPQSYFLISFSLHFQEVILPQSLVLTSLLLNFLRLPPTHFSSLLMSPWITSLLCNILTDQVKL